MKFFLIALFAAVAFAAPDVTWSEDGQYKLVVREPLEVLVKPEVSLDGAEPLKIALAKEAEKETVELAKEPLMVKYIMREPLNLGYVQIPRSVPIPLGYRRLVLRDIEPFTYHYEQITH